MIRVAVVDDHPMVRAGLRAYLGQSPELSVVAEAANCRDGVELIRRIAIDIVILDLAMPGQGGLEALRSMKIHAPHVPVLVLSGYPADKYAETAVRLGASGYLDKTCDPQDIVDAIRRVCAPLMATESSRVPDAGSSGTSDSERAPHDLLNSREFQIFLRLAKGESTSSIAKGLFLSPATVSVYRCRLTKKLKLKNNSQITRYAMKYGLI